MIEFRAACGHSIRAKEEDAGKTVRCNYCGASVQVPDPSASSLDYLFATEAEQATERGVQARQRARKSGGPRIPIIGNMLNETNPVRLMLTFVYIGIVLVVLGVGGRLLYSYAKGYLAERKAGRPVVSRAPSQGTAGGEVSSSSGGQQTPTGQKSTKVPFPMLETGGTGLYITSVPAGALVFLRRADDDAQTDAELGKDESKAIGKTPLRFETDPGEYVVGLALPSTQRDLAQLPEYADLRRDLRGKTGDEASRKYFISDGSTDLRVDRPPGAPAVFVRKYTVFVRKDKWAPVTGLFLPNGTVEVLLPYLPKEKAFNVDAERVLAELRLQDVPAALQSGIIEALERIGKAVYRSEDGQFRVFQLLPDPDELLYSSVAP